MSNFNYGAAASARYHLECPICSLSKGEVKIEETASAAECRLKLTCKTCGNLGTTDFDLDFAVPSGISPSEHGKSIGEILTVWLKDNPPPAVDQLAAVGRKAVDEIEAGPITECPKCHAFYRTEKAHKCVRRRADIEEV